ncbi:hypothetical protein SLEP1_g48465 [Rubroshorea leprosula]|uniref:UTP23 sensor motif region domain-containing protein n=1 Tax=Rubroshorea leprosula TaxID=152421 RepID=A0AAV5LWJ8_9ROSI|nr:hypothetical protein SLEP1_g48465 [Rubroshorea leprosula]
MKVKKQKRHRKTVRFFSVCFGFRQPFKVLCDGTFVHHLLVNNITPADTALSNCLGAPVKLFTTRCILAELKTLGASYSHSFQAANKLTIARCDHEKRKGADACILDVIGQNNPEHFFVATQHVDLRNKLQEVPGVPLIFALRNALFLEPPSSFQHQFVKASEEKRLHMTEKDHKLLERKTGGLLENEDVAQSNDVEGLESHDPGLQAHNTRKRSTGKKLGVKDRVQFKRKKAKGPNPLSCKKKRSHENPNPSSIKESKEGDNIVRRNRRRKRPRRDKSIAGADKDSK